MLALLAAFALAAAAAVPPPPTPAAARLDALFDAPGTPYLNGAVLAGENGRVVYARAFGFADRAMRAPNTVDARFQTASLSKVFTSTAILQLADAKRLRLDDPVVAHLRAFPFPAITIRHLLSHTSGLPDLELYEPLVAREPDRVIANADVLPALAEWKQGLAFTPGSQFRYCNTNYVVLALIVEQASGMPFARYLERRVFAPAGMRDTYVRTRDTPPDPRVVKNHVLPAVYDTLPVDVTTVHLKDPVTMRHIRYETYNLGATLGDQNVITTLPDLFRFAEALQQGKVLRPATLAEATTAVRFTDGTIRNEPYDPYNTRCSYGLGWDVCDDAERGKLIGHSGYNRGIATMLYIDRAKRQTVVAFDNEDGEDFDPKFASIVNVLTGRPPLDVDRRVSLTREYGRLLLERGANVALIRYNEMRADTAHFTGTQRGLNRLGYDLLHNGYTAESLEPFRINVVLHPDDANVYDSYAEALAANGRNEDAIAMYEKALQLDPSRESAKKALARLRGTR
ncbi:MAG: serine hydrolase [Acidobacteria bacterium]|nr:serine hydrolase [Acidobacteriota bacterium]MBV9478916.1 serine hydrolase [Acidobacteriota bacterium]